jgi:hypothetical protein
MARFVVFAWNYVFNHDVSPLRHIPDIGVRHMILQMLGWMWAVAFACAIGSYSSLGISLVGHAFLVGAAAITVATYTTATVRPATLLNRLGRRRDGEHE